MSVSLLITNFPFYTRKNLLNAYSHQVPVNDRKEACREYTKGVLREAGRGEDSVRVIIMVGMSLSAHEICKHRLQPKFVLY